MDVFVLKNKNGSLFLNQAKDFLTIYLEKEYYYALVFINVKEIKKNIKTKSKIQFFDYHHVQFAEDYTNIDVEIKPNNVFYIKVLDPEFE